MWYYLCGEPLPSLTLIGSSNYGKIYLYNKVLNTEYVCCCGSVYVYTLCVLGHRSLTRDLEAQAAVVTTNRDLRQSLHYVSARDTCESESAAFESERCDFEKSRWLWTLLHIQC